MSLDERVRAGLQRSADSGRLDADTMFDAVVASHRRGRLRARLVQQATASAVVLTLFAGLAVFVSWRTTPVRYRSVAVVAFGGLAASGAPAGPAAGPVHLALVPGTRRATLLAAHLSPDNTEVEFRATTTGVNQVSLTATADSRDESAIVTDKWASTLAVVRRKQAEDALLAARRKVALRIAALHRRLQAVDAQLAQLDPKTYGSIWKYDGPNGNVSTGRAPQHTPPPVPERGTPHELNLAFERIQLISALQKYGEGQTHPYNALTPDVSTKRISQKAPARVDTSPAATGPASAVWIAGLALILAASIVIYRRRARGFVGG